MNKLQFNSIQMLRLKILFLPLLCILLTIAATFIITVTFVPGQIEDSFEQQLNNQVNQLTERLHYYFEEFMKTSEMIGNNPVFLSTDLEAINHEMQKLVDTSIQISGLSLIDPNGEIELLYPPTEGGGGSSINVSTRPYFQQALLTKEVFLSDVTHAATDRVVIVNGVPILHPETGQVVKVLGVSINLVENEFIQNLLKKDLSAFNGVSYVVDPSGVILSYKDTSVIGQNISVVDATVAQLHMNGYDVTQIMMNAAEEEMLTVYKKVESLQWSVIAQIPRAELKRGNAERFYTLATYCIGIALFMILLTWVLTRRLLRPLKELERTMSNVIDGDFTQTIQLPNAHDLNSVVDVFNRMIMKIAENKENLEKMALYDSLTGLYNHRVLQELSAREFAIAKKRDIPLSVMFLDIDRFKRVNDMMGHHAGDKVLSTISKLIVDVVRPSDTVGRYGGEEIVIICPNADLSVAKQIAERIRNAIRDYPFEEGRTQPNGRITVSIGVASTSSDAVESRDELIQLTDQRMYLAKQRGRDQVVYDSRGAGRQDLRLS